METVEAAVAVAAAVVTPVEIHGDTGDEAEDMHVGFRHGMGRRQRLACGVTHVLSVLRGAD